MTARRIYQRLRDLTDVLVSSPADGEVLTYSTSAGKWENQAGGGGSQPARNVGQCELDFNGAGTGVVTLAFGDGDAAMVDLTDPTYPKVVEPGRYAYTVVGTIDVPGGNPAHFDLLVDDNYYSIHARTGPTVDSPGTACVVWFCDAADPFRLTLVATPGDTFTGSIYVQKMD